MKNILVTGCSTGIGRALAVELGSRGHRVFATARRPETLDGIAREHVVPIRLDVLDPESRRAAVARAMELGGTLDALVNNAGVSLIAPLVEAPFDRVRALIETNLTGTIAMIQLAFPHMRAGGRIMNVGSVIGVLPSPFTAAYCATKAGVHMLSDVLRLELAPFGIHVITAQPAAVRSEIEDRSAEGLEAFASEQSRYHRYHAALRWRAERPKQNPVTAEDYARDLADALLADRPPRVVRGGRGSALMRGAARLPPRIRDFFLRREFGLQASE